MKIQFLGATETVTGSKYLLRINNSNILIDCGLFQGLKELRLRNWAPLAINPRQIDAVVLTHAHLDHSGYLPLFVKQGFRGKVYCTPGTRDLCKILLPDSGYLQEEEARYANRRGFSKHHPALPLYTQSDAEYSLAFFQGKDFHERFQIAGDIEVEFLPAGHILGSAMLRIQIKGRTILFTGDLGRPCDPIMRAPEHVLSADYLVVESTYGNRKHDIIDPKLELAEIVNRTVERGGVVVVPAFAVGRAQSLMYYVWLLKKEKLIPDIPVFLNSPMAIDASELYEKYPLEQRLSPEEWQSACHVARYVRDAEESKKLNSLQNPALIISASGMATGGRVLHHLKAYAPDPRNTILLAGYQAIGTRGQSIADGAESVKIHGQMIPIRAEVQRIDSLSAHADADEILQWLSHFTKAPRKTWITHGDPSSSTALKGRIEEMGWICNMPRYLQSEDLT